jgi:heme-degrading monooxygenase HmoA
VGEIDFLLPGKPGISAEDVLNILKESSSMIEEQAGTLMSMLFKPEKKDGPVTGFSMWESREKFTYFMKSDHMEQIMKTGLADKVKNWTTDIKASLFRIEQAWHVESHE